MTDKVKRNQFNGPVYNGPLTRFPLSICTLYFTILVHFFLAYRNCWTMDGSVRRFSLDTWMLTLDSGHWTRDAGPWTLDPGFWILDSGRYILDAGLSHWDCLWLFYWRIIIQFLILLDFFLWEIELHYKQLSYTAQKHLS